MCFLRRPPVRQTRGAGENKNISGYKNALTYDVTFLSVCVKHFVVKHRFVFLFSCVPRPNTKMLLGVKVPSLTNGYVTKSDGVNFKQCF